MDNYPRTKVERFKSSLATACEKAYIKVALMSEQDDAQNSSIRFKTSWNSVFEHFKDFECCPEQDSDEEFVIQAQLVQKNERFFRSASKLLYAKFRTPISIKAWFSIIHVGFDTSVQTTEKEFFVKDTVMFVKMALCSRSIGLNRAM